MHGPFGSVDVAIDGAESMGLSADERVIWRSRSADRDQAILHLQSDRRRGSAPKRSVYDYEG